MQRGEACRRMEQRPGMARFLHVAAPHGTDRKTGTDHTFPVSRRAARARRSVAARIAPASVRRCDARRVRATVGKARRQRGRFQDRPDALRCRRPSGSAPRSALDADFRGIFLSRLPAVLEVARATAMQLFARLLRSPALRPCRPQRRCPGQIHDHLPARRRLASGRLNAGRRGGGPGRMESGSIGARRQRFRPSAVSASWTFGRAATRAW